MDTKRRSGRPTKQRRQTAKERGKEMRAALPAVALARMGRALSAHDGLFARALTVAKRMEERARRAMGLAALENRTADDEREIDEIAGELEQIINRHDGGKLDRAKQRMIEARAVVADYDRLCDLLPSMREQVARLRDGDDTTDAAELARVVVADLFKPTPQRPSASFYVAEPVHIEDAVAAFDDPDHEGRWEYADIAREILRRSLRYPASKVRDMITDYRRLLDGKRSRRPLG